jgi:hypothetical protein
MRSVATGDIREHGLNGQPLRVQESPQSAVAMELLRLRMISVAGDMLESLGTSCRGCGPSRSGGSSDEISLGPSGSEDPHTDIERVREVIELGENLGRVCWGRNAVENRAVYLAGNGHVVLVKPRSQEGGGKPQVVRRVQAVVDRWMEVVQWGERQSDTSRRLDEHGESIDLLSYTPRGLRLGLIDPRDLDDDPEDARLDEDGEMLDEFGVRQTNDGMLQQVGAFAGSWFGDLLYSMDLAAEESDSRGAVSFDLPLRGYGGGGRRVLCQHRKRNVLRGARRGLTVFWSVRDAMSYGSELLANMSRVSTFQAAFGAIRTVDAAFSQDQVKAYLNTSQTGATGSGVPPEKFDFPSPGVVTIPSSVKLEFPETSRNVQNNADCLVQILRACASGLGVPEFMLTSNVSEGNFASTLVSEGPWYKQIQYAQKQMIVEDLRLLWTMLWWEVQLGHLPASALSAVTLEVTPPRIQTRNRKEDFDVRMELWKVGELSGRTMLAGEDLDRDSEQGQLMNERKTELGPPLGAMKPASPGPDPDPEPGAGMREKGVMAGEPPEEPEDS